MPWPSSAPPVASQTTLILSGVVRTPRAAIRQGFAAEYLDEEGCETLLDALGKRNLLSHTYRKALALDTKAASVDDVPEWKVKTKLQRAIQALKRHRDIFFMNRPGDRPASIIITTLAAQSYNGTESLYDALVKITATMPGFVKRHNGIWWVPNPDQPNENFADRWRTHPNQAHGFFEWIRRAESDFRAIGAAYGWDRTLEKLGYCLGDGVKEPAGAAVGYSIGRAGQAGQLGIAGPIGHVTTKPRQSGHPHTFHGHNRESR